MLIWYKMIYKFSYEHNRALHPKIKVKFIWILTMLI